MKDSPAFESRRVRTQPRTVTVEPTGTLPASSRETLTTFAPLAAGGVNFGLMSASMPAPD